ncbi:unnamed protein product [Rotaria magnacalcarata]|uniref:Glutathione transferase n=1 Tax=Rotaria magnacalcarata TaxID=392030 RepID=A0A816Z1W5_9BILA|nr:unnamed protein product [Rotaria magnacalcarata]CAF3879692.1 unnamed protein product [Rotaria magnacalcarata]CAF3887054.1 unnamed protein product [Rotaria magnacalcarata]CAF3905288.1 unnamed protein product [Rotaria magnacalcarata]
MSTYKLYYFNGRGRAEIARLIFAAAGEKVEDIRYEGSKWPSYKSKIPLGQMPVLEVDGVKLPQSMAIARFLAKQFDLAELPKHLETSGNLYSNGDSFFVGKQLTWTDLEVYDMLDIIIGINGDILQAYPWLQHHRQEVEKQPKIAVYLKSRPATFF